MLPQYIEITIQQDANGYQVTYGPASAEPHGYRVPELPYGTNLDAESAAATAAAAVRRWAELKAEEAKDRSGQKEGLKAP